MHFEPRLWIFTTGVRLRILAAVVIGLVAIGLGVARLALLGWLIAEVFAGMPPEHDERRDPRCADHDGGRIERRAHGFEPAQNA